MTFSALVDVIHHLLSLCIPEAERRLPVASAVEKQQSTIGVSKIELSKFFPPRARFRS
jgi:hypothetical protein